MAETVDDDGSDCSELSLIPTSDDEDEEQSLLSLSDDSSSIPESMLDSDSDDEEDVDWRRVLGETRLEEVRAWLADNGYRHIALHQNRATGQSVSDFSYNYSWKRVHEEVTESFPNLPEGFLELDPNESMWCGLVRVWEDVFEGWMAVGNDKVREWVRGLPTEEALDAAKAHYVLSMADQNLTSFVVEMLERPPASASSVLRAVQRACELSRRGLPDPMAHAFNFPNADDLLRHTLSVGTTTA